MTKLQKYDEAKLANLEERMFTLKKRIFILDDVIRVIKNQQADYQDKSEINAKTVFFKEAWDRFNQASPKDLKEALQRYQIIEPYLKGEKQNDKTTPARTIRDWKAKYRAAQEQYGCGYLGLLSHRKAQGNQLAKLPEDSLNLMEQFITDNYEILKYKQKKMQLVYGSLIKSCAEKSLIAPSYKTFTLSVHKRFR